MRTSPSPAARSGPGSPHLLLSPSPPFSLILLQYIYIIYLSISLSLSQLTKRT